MLAGRRRDPGLLTITVTVGVGVGVAVAVAAAGEPGNVAISGGSWYNRVTSPPQPGTGPSPGVLLVGDAVSGPGTGYLRQLQRLLSPGLATVQFAAAPAVPNSTGLPLPTAAAVAECIEGWVGNTRRWDVVVIAVGLGDCRYGQAGGGPDEFGATLETIVSKARASSGRGGAPVAVLYVNTAPFGGSVAGFNRSCIEENNRAAAARMPQGSVVDLAGAISGYCGRAGFSEECRLQPPGSFLLNSSDAVPSGLQFAAVAVARAIQAHVPVAKVPCELAARNGTAVRCSWPPAPAPRPPAPPLPPLARCSLRAALGCFGETKDHLVLPRYAGALVPNGNVTIELCAGACARLSLATAGIDGGNHCFCGTPANLYAARRSARPMTECRAAGSPCAGNRTEKCGSPGRLFAYNFTCQSSRSQLGGASLERGSRISTASALPDPPELQCGGGVDSFPLNKSIPNVLLIGDSVMFGHYGPVVKQIFDRCELAPDFCENSTEILPKGRYPNDGMLASVQTTGQAGNSASGAMCIGSYLAGKKWDLISVNFGIHDTWEHQYVPPKSYGENLVRIFTAAKAALTAGGKLIWTSTTPISSNCTGCGDGTTTAHVVEYNAIARTAFENVVGPEIGLVNDLHGEVNAVCGVNFTVCNLQAYNNEHPSIAGAAFLGIKTAEIMLPYLAGRPPGMSAGKEGGAYFGTDRDLEP